MGVTVRTSGPLFDGRAAAEAARAARGVEEQIGQEAFDAVRAELGHVLRHPTGYYESHIQTDRSAGSVVVNDSGVVYGPWLEGTGSRNQTTRFKGYTTFRRIAQRIDARAHGIAERVVDRYVRRMN